ncbi:MAG: hypothetical protein H7067_14805, partial [Burkholderiales bacterium]|nr:hypothetical protein [Opitutaceae bacterium]
LKGVSNYYRNFLGGLAVGRHGEETLGKLVGMMKSRAKKLAKPQPAPAPVPAPAAVADPDFDEANPFG